MRKQNTRPAVAVILGVALLAGAAPISLCSQIPAPKQQSAPAKKSGTTAKKRQPRPRGQTAPTAERIREIQTALTAKSFYSGEPSGKWDARSIEAMKKFQSANGLTETGKFDAKSLQKLGLGSQVAGAAAPRRPPDPANPKPPQP